MLLIILTIFIIIWYIIRKIKNKKENYSSYKKITITPTRSVWMNLKLNTYHKNSLHHELGTILAEIYPIRKVNISKNTYKSLQNTNKYINHLSLVDDTNYSHYIEKNTNNNIRFISSLGIEYFTLIVKSSSSFKNWFNLKGSKIGVFSKSDASYKTLKKILVSFDIQSVIIHNIPITKEGILKAFQQNKIDAFFIITSHPNKNLHYINNIMKLRFIGINGLNKDKLKLIFPYFTFNKMDLSYYGKILDSSVETIETRINLICHKNSNRQEICKLLETIFSNFIHFKIYGCTEYRLAMRPFNPSYIYLNYPFYKLHIGAKDYYHKIGLITDKNINSCKFKVGIGKCTKKVNHFRLL